MNAPAMTPCPACPGWKPRRFYLCRPCWHRLPDAAQTALNRRGDGTAAALGRLRELHRQLLDDVPLEQIRITP